MHSMDFIINPWFGGIAGLLGLIGTVFGIWTYFRPRSTKRLSLNKSSISVVGTTSSAFSNDVRVLFRGQEVPIVTSTTLTLWNSGHVTVDGSDVSKLEPLRIELTGESRVLDAQVVKTSRSVVGAEIGRGESPNSIWLKFDFLDKGDGISIQVLHTASDAQVRLSGTIKGIPNGVRQYAEPSQGSRLNSFREGVVQSVVALAAVVMLVGANFRPPSDVEIRLKTEIVKSKINIEQTLSAGPPRPEVLAEWSALGEIKPVGPGWQLNALLVAVLAVNGTLAIMEWRKAFLKTPKSLRIA